MFGATPAEKAYTGPFLVFLALLALGEVAAGIFDGRAFWMAAEPRYWIFPLQTFVCGVLLARWWRHYSLRLPGAKPLLWAAGIGIAVLALWIGPAWAAGWVKDRASLESLPLLGSAFSPRLRGFEPEFFGAEGPAYFANVAVRFVRLVVIVPLVEEIFWRGFLLRWLIHHDFTRVPIGAFSWPSFWIVTAGFCLEHHPADWPAAVLAGALYNLVAYRTGSLAACVLSHALTNLLLGLYVMQTRQWGFW
jgi:uncharacterized protein